MIFVTDAAGGNIYSSPEWQWFTGQAVEQALGFGWASQVHPDDVNCCNSIVQAAVKLQKPFTTTHRIHKSDDGFTWIVSGAQPVFCPQSTSLVGFMGSITEASDQTWREAFGSVGTFTPPAPHPHTMPSSSNDLAVDHLLLARSLVGNEASVRGAIDLALYLMGKLYRSHLNVH